MEKLLIITSALLLLSIFLSKAAGRFGVPSLLVFLGIGVLVPFRVHNLELAQGLAIVSLCFILFSSGLSTNLAMIRPILKSGIVLATVGVLLAAVLVGWFGVVVLGFTLLPALILGATIASTDAAAVFTVLRSRQRGLTPRLQALIEFESAANDPISVMLTVGLLDAILHPQGLTFAPLAILLIQQISLGLAMGWIGGYASRYLINGIRLGFDGLYPALSVALVLFIYSVTQYVGGSGFLAVYLVGMHLGNHALIHKRSLTLFHDGLAWITQIAMFLVMGLLITPGDLYGVAPEGFALSLFLMFIARPLSVHLCLLPFGYSYREILTASWVGLRGAVPIILATYPLIAGLPESRLIFELVFFVVLSSVLIQGTSVAPVARWLKTDAPMETERNFPIEYNPTESLKNELVEIPVDPKSAIVGLNLYELVLPTHTLVVLIRRDGEVLVPKGATRIRAGDVLLVLCDRESLELVKTRLS